VDTILHPDWNSRAIHYNGNLALLKLDKSIQFSTSTCPIIIPHSDQDVDQSKGIILHTLNKNENPISVQIPASEISTRECLAADRNLIKILYNDLFCAKQDELDFCSSGYSEAYFTKLRHKDVLVGRVTIGFKTSHICHRKNNLVITSTLKYSDWIYKEICNSSDGKKSPEVEKYPFKAGVYNKNTQDFLCWSYVIGKFHLLTSKFCFVNFITNYKTKILSQAPTVSDLSTQET
jgi:Trypsin